MIVQFLLAIAFTVFFALDSFASDDLSLDVARKRANDIFEALEWDPQAPDSDMLHQQREYWRILSASAAPYDRHVGLILLALAGEADAPAIASRISSVANTKDEKIAIGVTLCLAKGECDGVVSNLRREGRETICAGDAISIKNLPDVYLLSLLPQSNFSEYIRSLRTEEEFQRAALKIALMRHERLFFSTKSQ
jgi:hypothetical protein